MKTMKKILAWLLVLTLTAAVSIGATLAYLTDTDEDVNVMTLGKVKIDQLEYERVDTETENDEADVQEFHDNKPLYPAVTEDGFDYTPGDSSVDWEQIGKDGYTSEIWDPAKINNELDKMVFVKNKGDYDAYVRSVFAFEANGYTFEEFQELFHLNINETDWTWEWAQEPVEISDKEGTTTTNYFIATATYNKVLKPGELTEISLSQIALDSKADNADIAGFGDTYQVLVKSQGIQADGFDGPDSALNEGFGTVIENTGTAESPLFTVVRSNLPFANDSAIKGIDLRTALHNLGGNTANPITAKVTNVIFGKTADYAAVADNYDGTLVDVEQDVPVYAYYVPNGSNYDVYFLSNDKVFLPGDSNGLFRNMKALLSITPGNMDTSRVTTMRNMLCDCQVLSTLDTTTWDTGMVNDMGYMFLNCYALQNIEGTEQWDVSNVTNMLQTFAFCKKLKELNASGWDVSNVTNMVGTFGQCFDLEKVDTTGWNPVNVTSTQNMFFNGYKLKEVVGSGDWYMPNNTTLYGMFQSCSSLEYLDVTDWDLSSVENMRSTFWSCTSLKEIDGTENWNTGNVKILQATFEHCTSLVDLDVSTWDTGNVTSLHGTFYNCHSLPYVDVSNWDTGNVTTMQGTFSGDGQNTGEMLFTELAVENWDVSKVTNMNSMFYGCAQLTELDLSKWDTSNVTVFRHTFTDCFKLEKLNFTGWNTESATNFDGMFNDCMELKELDLSAFDTGNATTFHQFFEGCASLTTVIGMENWDTSKVTDTSEMFNANGKDMHLEYVDLSAFDTSSLTTTYSMFNGCNRLTTVYVGSGWDMSKVTSSGSMFNGCGSLTGANGTTTAGNPTDVTYARVDTPAIVDGEGTVITEAVPGYLTYQNISDTIS